MSNGFQMPHVIKWLTLKWTCVIKKSISYTCSYICNLLYEYKQMKNINILYVHHMYNMLHATCFMQLNQKLNACVACKWKLVTYDSCKMTIFF
jgi:hypothetical protein